MRMSSEDVHKHINTIWKQREIVKFLSEREQTDEQSIKIILDSFQLDIQEGKLRLHKINPKISIYNNFYF